MCPVADVTTTAMCIGILMQFILFSGVKEGWKQAWKLMVQELAPQDNSGAYVRQNYSFTTKTSEIKVSSRHG
jgi:hypothetical protein